MAQKPNPDELAEQLLDLVIGLRRRAQGDFAGRTLKHPQHAVLKRLEKGGPATTADLARAELMTPQAMGALVGTLEDAGFVTRRDDTDDSRRRLLGMTAAGKKALAANRAARHRWLAGLVTEHFDTDEQRKVGAALGLLSKLLVPKGS